MPRAKFFNCFGRCVRDVQKRRSGENITASTCTCHKGIQVHIEGYSFRLSHGQAAGLVNALLSQAHIKFTPKKEFSDA